jgi:hypothetical protein
VLILAAMGLLSFHLIKKFEHRIASWRQSAEW